MHSFNSLWNLVSWTLLLTSVALAAPAILPKVKLGDATFVGKNHGKTEKFLGIRYAHGPRYGLPVPVTGYGSEDYDVSKAGFSCPQQPGKLAFVSKVFSGAAKLLSEGLFAYFAPENEDCLNLDITRPAGTSTNSKFPIVVWIYGGAFSWGSTDLWMYEPRPLVELSMKENEPMILVSLNYRVGGWGFLDSKDVRDGGIGNLGLQDQREALRWIQRNIVAFGGDPSRVTLWGESAGAISIGLHMVVNGGNTEGLFHGAFLQSGGILPIGKGLGGQPEYDTLINLVGCQDHSNKIDCLRKVPYEKLRKVLRLRGDTFDYMDPIPPWIPRVDGLFLKEAPTDAVANGRMANIPMIIGNTADEGTFFASYTPEVVDSTSLEEHIRTKWFPRATPQEIQRLLVLYPPTVDQDLEGAPDELKPFISSQYQRVSDFLSDGIFHAPRRWMIEHAATGQKIWVYNNARSKKVPVLGATHASDIFHMFRGGEMQKYLVNFVSNQNPNTPPDRIQSGIIQWPQYESAHKYQLEVTDGLWTRLKLSTDTYRSDAIGFLQMLSQKYPQC